MTTTKATITFQELGLSAVILKALKEIGFETTFPIQKAAIPLLLKGVDVIVAITQIGNNFGYLHRLHFSAWHYFCYAIY
jgi:hypothetical protein